MGFLQSRRGQVSLGLLIFSAGGIVLTNLAAAATDPQQKLVIQAAVVFWVIFMLKNIYFYAWVPKESVGAAPVVEAPRTRSAAAAATATERPRRRAQRA